MLVLHGGYCSGPLRPLWPALGIIGVTIIVAMFMSGSSVIEKVAEKHKRARINRADTNSIGTETHEEVWLY